MPRTQQPSTGLGIEDELSFGSDEDLIADVGEIALPATVPDSLSNAKADKDKKSRFKLSGKKKSEEASALASAHSQSSTREMRDTSRKKEKKSKEGFSLASASIVLDPQMESVLDLTSGGAYYNAGSASGGSTPSLPSLTSGSTTSSRKKGGFRNALKGLGMKKESEQNSHFVTRQREKLDKLKQVHSIDSFSTGEYCKFDFQNVLDHLLITCCQPCNHLSIYHCQPIHREGQTLQCLLYTTTLRRRICLAQSRGQRGRTHCTRNTLLSLLLPHLSLRRMPIPIVNLLLTTTK